MEGVGVPTGDFAKGLSGQRGWEENEVEGNEVDPAGFAPDSVLRGYAAVNWSPQDASPRGWLIDSNASFGTTQRDGDRHGRNPAKTSAALNSSNTGQTADSDLDLADRSDDPQVNRGGDDNESDNPTRVGAMS